MAILATVALSSTNRIQSRFVALDALLEGTKAFLLPRDTGPRVGVGVDDEMADPLFSTSPTATEGPVVLVFDNSVPVVVDEIFEGGDVA